LKISDIRLELDFFEEGWTVFNVIISLIFPLNDLKILLLLNFPLRDLGRHAALFRRRREARVWQNLVNKKLSTL